MRSLALLHVRFCFGATGISFRIDRSVAAKGGGGETEENRSSWPAIAPIATGSKAEQSLRIDRATWWCESATPP